MSYRFNSGKSLILPSPDGWRHCARVGTLMLVLGLILFLGAQSVNAQQYQTHQSIRDTVDRFIGQYTQDQKYPPRIEIGNLDPRLQVQHCNYPLEAFYPQGSRTWGNSTVGVRCQGPRPWTLYVPVSVRIFNDAMVTTRTLPRGSKLTKRDYITELREVSSLPNGYLSSSNQVLDKVLTRTLSTGAVITDRSVENPHIVRRGERVTVIARGSGIEVRMIGIALMDGAVGERIKIKNTASKRVLEGSVDSNGTIVVRM